jgi:hypothetical protein
MMQPSPLTSSSFNSIRGFVNAIVTATHVGLRYIIGLSFTTLPST